MGVPFFMQKIYRIFQIKLTDYFICSNILKVYHNSKKSKN